MKKVLILTPEIPFPTFKGNQHRIDATIKVLLDLGVDVSLAILNSNQMNRSSLAITNNLKNYYKNIKEVEVRKNTNIFQEVDNKPLNNFYKKIVKNVDKAFIQGDISNLTVCPLKYRRCVAELVKKIEPTHIIVNYAKLTRAIPKDFKGITILDCHDIQTNILRESIKINLKKTNININDYFKEELSLLNSYNTVISINKNETKQLYEAGVKSKLVTIPGFNTIENLYKSKADKKYDILFVGSGSPFNVEGVMKFIAKCYPKIKKEMPNVNFAIAGDVSTCSALKKVNDPTIIRLGRVDSLKSLYADSKLVISSIISGAGMKVKNIEALSYGMPIVATTFSMDGIDVQHEVTALMQDDWGLFAQNVINLLKDPKKRIMLSENAEKLASLIYSKEMAKEKYKALILNNTNSSHEVDVNSLATLFEKSEKVVSNKIEIPIKNEKYKRIKALIFSTDAAELMDYNIALAKSLNEVNVYSEFIKMDYGCENRFYKHGFLVYAIRDKITKERRAELKKQIHVSVENDEVVGFCYKGIDISDEINIYKQMFPSHFKKSIKDVVVHGILILEQIINLIEKLKSDFLVGWNGNGPHFIFLMKVAAKIKNIPVYHVERGLLPQTFVVDSRGVNFKSSIAGSFLPLLNNEERNFSKKYIQSYRDDSSTIVNNQLKLNLDKVEILSRLGLDTVKDYIFFPMQIEGDSNIIINSPKYKKMSQVITDLVKVAEQLNVYVICRPHPENNINEVFDDIVKTDNLIIDSSIHLHDMLKNSIANIVINSTVGLESLLLARPTIALGHSVYSSKNITFDAYSAEDILQAILKILSGTVNYKLIESRTEALIAYLFHKQLLRLDVAPEENKKLLETLLEKHGFRYNKDQLKPKAPSKTLNYIKLLSEFNVNVEKAKIINVYNKLEKDTVQYLNGSKKPLIDERLIRNHFKDVYGKSITLKRGKFTGKSGNEDQLNIVIIKGGVIMDMPKISNTYWVDEYFELI